MELSFTSFCFRVALLSLLLQIVAGACEDSAVGLSDSTKITNDKFSSSSVFDASTPASNGRLNYTGGPSWCASSSDSTPYLEVDLGSSYIICAVATQGNSQAGQWVKTYQLQSSEDKTNWTPYQEKRRDKIFQGNYDRTTTVKHLLYEGLQARYVRVYPKTHQGLVCLRLELSGKSISDCSSTAVGVADSSTVPDYRFTASSSYHIVGLYRPWFARLNGPNGWVPSTINNVQNEWLQIDLGSSYFICAVATQGHGLNKEYVKKYKLKLSMNNKDWKVYKDGGVEKNFTGGSSNTNIKKNSLDKIELGKFIRLNTLEGNPWPSTRMEVYGVTQVCRSSLGMEDGSIPNSQITASTGTASNGRLYSSGAAWCGTIVSIDYLQVDLGQSVTILGVATQGHPTSNNWVTEYFMKYSHDDTTWYDHKENQQTKTLFTGNTDKNSVFVNWFNNYVSARFIRVYPTSANRNPCMRMDLYGCVHSLAPTVEVTDKKYSPVSGDVSITCNVTGNSDSIISWEYKNGDVTDQSSIVTHSNGLTMSRLNVTVPGIDDVLSGYTCRRTNPSTRDVQCTSPPYFCKARYSGGGPNSVGSATIVTNLEVPDAPTVTIGSVKLSSVHIRWTHSSLNPSKEKPVKSFKVTISVTGHPDVTASLGPSDRSYVLKNPVLYKTYTVRVVAVSDVGEGLVGLANFRTDFPPKPTSISVSKLFGSSAVISWVQPASTSGQGAVTSFKIDYGILGESSNVRSVTASSSATSATIVGLRLAAVYNVTVIPFSTRGAGVGLSKIINTQARCDGVPIAISGPINVQLNYTAGSSWCASSSDSSPYLEVDLRSDHLICAITTQGNSQSDQWVKTYQVQTSKDKSGWSDYKEGVRIKLFEGNYDRNTEVKYINYGVMQGRYLRVLPKSHHSGACLRVAVYGISTQDCSSTAVGVADSSAVPDYRFTASSTYSQLNYKPWFARLNGNYGWTPSKTTDVPNEWLKIDLGSSYFICAVATQGHGQNNEYIKKYKLNLSNNNKDWKVYSEGGSEKVFPGNKNHNTVVKGLLQELAQGKLIQFRPTIDNNYWPSVRVEVYGIIQACQHSLGVEDDSISNSSLSASSGTATDGRLYGASSWCASSLGDYLQVDLGGVKTVTGIATQGDPGGSKYVTSYSISYSLDGSSWEEYKDSTNRKMTFSHTKMDKMEVNWIPTPLTAAYIQVFPVTSVGGYCLRLDVYGCDGVVAKPSISMADLFLSSFGSTANLVCSVTGQPLPVVKWQHKGNSISSSETPSNGVITSTYTVMYANPASILSDHVCHRGNVSTRHVNCTSPPYACKARYTGGEFAGTSAVVIVNLLTPDAVTGLAVETLSARSLNIKWISPDTGDMPITSYRVEYIEDTLGATNKTETATGTSHVITSLKPYTTYAIRVVAVSALGEGLWSSAIKHRTDQAAPTKPENLVVKVDAQYPRVSISWKPPKTPKGAISWYTVYYRYLPDGNLLKDFVNRKESNFTVNVTGGLNYRFEVSATTVAEGPKAAIEKNVREYAPDAPPSSLTLRHVSTTTYNCSWDPPPRARSHGTIIKYNVKYTSQPNVRRKRSSDDVLVITEKTHVLLYNLKLCERLSVSVRAWTNVGPGPYSKEHSVENAAMPPENIKIVKIERESIKIEWTEPPFLQEKIRGYKVRYQGFKTYDVNFNDEGELETNTRQSTLLVTNLFPGTRYQFQIATKAGCSTIEYSNKVEAVTKIEKPIAPNVLDVLEETKAKSSVKVTMLPAQPRNGPISSYQIIVLLVKQEQDSLPENFYKNSYGYLNASKAGIPFYITLEIPAANVINQTEVIIGDGRMKGGYFNAKLQEGKRYKLFVRAVTREDGTVYYGEYAKIADVTVGNKTYSPTCCPSSGEGSCTYLLGVIGALVAIIVVLIITNAVSLWKLRKANSTSKGGDKSQAFTEYDNIDSTSQMELKARRRPDQFQKSNTSKDLQARSLKQNNTLEPSVRHTNNETLGNRQDYMELQASGQLEQPKTYASLNKKGEKCAFPAASSYQNVALEGVSGQDEDMYEELPSEA